MRIVALGLILTSAPHVLNNKINKKIREVADMWERIRRRKGITIKIHRNCQIFRKNMEIQIQQIFFNLFEL